ncbi:hypothetical protein NA56DRAFT_713670 [Hyaloscypha hepaticicola]|uniref:Major facilitator superfamily (MFS) profile domain-containing protein n=1 Tax=Hyaloscypha hepaticicola TaxID=2082293 RepID=A0A2J6PDI0_9HELO|nr:hypothetical protein NA56DRAFT_713670 [Hyaloscypha hepaticicola]
MSIPGWICFWSFFVGVGTSAVRTLSAVITAEYDRLSLQICASSNPGSNDGQRLSDTALGPIYGICDELAYPRDAWNFCMHPLVRNSLCLSQNSTSHLLDRGDTLQSDTSISQIFMQDSIHSIIAVFAGSLVGSKVRIGTIDYISRRKLLFQCFLGLAFLFVIEGGCLFNTSHINLQALNITLSILTQILSNLGPNALNFIVSAEIFTTRYRSICYGISASFGTLIVYIVTSYTSIDNLSTLSLRLMLIVFSAFMFCGAIIAWAWIPESQEVRRGRPLRLSSTTLEILKERIDAERRRRLD